MRRADFIIGLALLVFAGLYYQQSLAIVRGFASDRLGPAFYPRLLAGVLTALAATLIVRAAGDRSDAAPLPPTRAPLLLFTVGMTAVYALLLPSLGYLIATPLLLGTVVWVLGLRSLPRAAAAAVGMTAVLYVVFGKALHVLLPMGPLTQR